MTTELRNQRRQFWIILIIVFFGFLGISIPYLIFPPLFLNPDYSFLAGNWSASSRALLLGVTLAVYPFGQFIGSPILGVLSDDYGRKHLITGTLVLSGIGNLLVGIAIVKEQLLLLIISRFLTGLMEGNIAVARGMCADLKLLPKQETFGKLSAATSIAYLIGPFLGGLMTDRNLYADLNTSTPFYFICVLFFALAALSMLVLKETFVVDVPKIGTLWQRFNFLNRMRVLFSNKNLKTLMITSTCLTLAVDMYYEFGPVYLTIKWTLMPAQLIYYNGVLCLGLAIGYAWLPAFIASRMSNLWAILGAILGFALLMVGIAWTNATSFMLLWFGLSGLVIGLAVTLLTVKISDCASDRIQGEVMGVQLSLRVLGDAIICLFGGVLLLVSPKIILILSAGIAILTMFYYKRVYPK